MASIKLIIKPMEPKVVEPEHYDSGFDSGEAGFDSSHSEWGYVVSKTGKTIIEDLARYSLESDIKIKADAIFNSMVYRVRRSKIRVQMLFYCVYCAHLELNRNVDPIELGGKFGLKVGEIQKCDSLFSPLQTGYRPPCTKISPLRYIPDYCKNLGLADEAIDGAMELADSILHKDRALDQENPQTVAAGFLKYYSTINGIVPEDPKTFIRITGRSGVTIETMYKRIAAIDND